MAIVARSSLPIIDFPESGLADRTWFDSHYLGLTSHNANRATLLEAPTITLTQLPDG
jgi:hypothetical protein